MSNKNGLLPPRMTHGNPEVSYYAVAEGGTLVAPTLVSPVKVQNTDTLLQPPVISSVGENHPIAEYVGALKLAPGGNDDSAIGANGIVIRAAAGPATVVEVGTDDEGPNLLLIAGADGPSQVYDETYNQPVALRALTLSATNPLCAPDPANVGELFRCAQAGVAAAAVSAIGTSFQVPKSGWYALQIEVQLGNAPAGPTSINVPITVAAGGVNLGEVLSFAITDGVVVEPYGLTEVSSNEMAVSEVLVANSIVVRNYTSLHLLDATQTYGFTLRSSSATWNIGVAGQIKAELIAMC